MSQLKVDSIVPRGGIASGEGGGIIQVVTTNISARTTVTGLSNTGFTDISGFSKAITLKSTSSKALIMIMCNASHQTNEFAMPMRVIRRVGGSDTNVNVGDSTGIRISGSAGYTQSGTPANLITFIGVDSPATTSEITYVMQLGSQSSQNICINGSQSNNANNAGVNQCVLSSSMTIMEICA